MLGLAATLAAAATDTAVRIIRKRPVRIVHFHGIALGFKAALCQIIAESVFVQFTGIPFSAGEAVLVIGTKGYTARFAGAVVEASEAAAAVVTDQQIEDKPAEIDHIFALRIHDHAIRALFRTGRFKRMNAALRNVDRAETAPP